MRNKPPLVLLPGTLCDERLWMPQIEALIGRADILVPRIDSRDDLEGLARDILKRIPWPSFNLAGLSMGGILALSLQRQAPQRIERLALLNTNPFAETPERQAQRRSDIEQAETMGIARYAREVLAPLYPADGTLGDTGHADLVVAMAERAGLEAFRRQALALRDRPDGSAGLSAISQPTLVLCGDGDRLCPPARHTYLAEHIPHSDLMILEGVGHLSTLQAPETVSQALGHWLTRELPPKQWRNS
ncbi:MULTISPECIES: alpha/beta fold hydrolase [unclassified Cobetia]|uniref:alpha/beta fold hydrolase n=1 Tax=unclassified Cobetia TaxID=2609414 RepID=UPI00178CF8C0|nr:MULTISPECIES: alpha/beta fold hydrolase [unclassified Cobetia]MBE2170257.1 alpha/beta fold hydrolase [Cobetia sp. 2AS1]MDH2446971.1 alpha/beta fold hydrolase [Cobetia sp. 2AS]